MPHAYVAIVSRGGALPDGLVGALAAGARGVLPFVPTDELSWNSADGGLAVLGFAGHGALDVGSYWDVEDGNLVMFSGLPVPHRRWWDGSTTWAAQLRTDIKNGSVVKACTTKFGVFTLAAAGADGAATFATDELGVAVLYLAEAPDWVVVASRASLAAIAAAHPQRPRRDLDELGWLFSFDNVVGEGTGYAGVRALPARSVVHVSPHRPVGVEARPFRRADEPGDLADAARDEICDHLRSVADAPGGASVGLTGGRDSRLVLAHLLHAGVQHRFRFVTWDLSEPDVAVARELAARYGLDHSVVEVADPASWTDALHELQRRTDGQLPATEVGRVMPSTGLFVSGGAGGLLSSVYGKQRPIRGADDVQAVFQSRVRRPPGDTICTADATDHYAARLRDIVASYAGHAPEHVLSLMYLDHRLHRWQGAVRESALRADAVPLLSVPAVAGAFATPHDERRRHGFHRQLWARTVPSLADRAFGEGGGRELWPGGSWPAAAALARDVLLGDPSNPVWSLVDARAVEAVTDVAEPPAATVRKQLINAVGLALWVRGADRVE